MRNLDFLKLSKAWLVFRTPVPLWDSSRAPRDTHTVRILLPEVLAMHLTVAWQEPSRFQGQAAHLVPPVPTGAACGRGGLSRLLCWIREYLPGSVSLSTMLVACFSLCPVRDVADIVTQGLFSGAPFAFTVLRDAGHCDSRKKHIFQSRDICPNNVPH